MDSERTFAWIRSTATQVTRASLLTWNDDDIAAFDPRPSDEPSPADATALPYPNAA